MILQTVRAEVERVIARRVFFTFAEVKTVDWAGQRCRARILTTGYLTNWLRVAAGYASSEQGEMKPLSAGDEVLACFPTGDPQGQGVVLARLYGGNAAPALAEQAWGVKRQSGSLILGADGKLAIDTTSCAISGSGVVEIDGSQVKLGGGTSGAVKFEELSSGLMPWCIAVQAAFQALGVTIGTPALGAARASKVTVG